MTKKVQRPNKKAELFPQEFDNEIRTCKIYLRNEPPLRKFLDRRILTSPSFRHWSVLCDFNDRKIQYHLYNLAEGPLIGGECAPHWNETDQDPDRPGLFKTNDYFLGNLMVSPKQVHHLAANHKLNGDDFHVTRRNCQVWALELLQNMDQNLCQNMDQNLCQNVKRIHHLKPIKDRRFASLVVASVKFESFMKNPIKYFTSNRLLANRNQK